MRILMLTHEFPPERAGVGTYAANLARAAAQLGHDVCVWAPDYGAPQVDTGDFAVQRFRGGRFGPRALLATLHRARRASSLPGFDRLHCLDWPHVASLGWWSRFGARPFMATAYGTEIAALGSARLSRLLRAQGALAAAQEIVAVSDFTRQLLLGRCADVDAARVRVVPLGVDAYWFESAGDPAQTRARYGIPDDRLVLLSVARLDPRKGHYIVVEALAALDASLQRQLVWVVVGNATDPAYARDLRQATRQLPLPVIFTGGIPTAQLRDLYHCADLFCLPGRPHPHKVEGFGLVYLEAAAQATPALACAVDAIPEVVVHEQTGIVVPRDDVHAYAAALAGLLAAPARRRQLGAVAQARARHFTWKRTAELTYGAGASGD